MSGDPPQGGTGEAKAPATSILARIGSDIGPRVISGVVLAASAMALTVAGITPFALMILAVALLLCWEWGRVVRGGDGDMLLVLHALTVTGAAVLAWLAMPVLSLIVVFIGAIVVGVLAFGQRSRLSALGVLYVGAPATALIWLRSDPMLGTAAIIFLYLCVWGTDTAAYFSGRLIGGPKLSPRISPNKTWSGLIGGVGTSALAGSLFAAFITGASAGRLAALGLWLGVVAQAGDLAESALKRRQGVKDASDLIPGHGGFLDRVDGFVIAVIAAALLAALVGRDAPARALLLGH